jgi:hypothetical protein
MVEQFEISPEELKARLTDLKRKRPRDEAAIGVEIPLAEMYLEVFPPS